MSPHPGRHYEGRKEGIDDHKNAIHTLDAPNSLTTSTRFGYTTLWVYPASLRWHERTSYKTCQPAESSQCETSGLLSNNVSIAEKSQLRIPQQGFPHIEPSGFTPPLCGGLNLPHIKHANLQKALSRHPAFRVTMYP